MKDDDIGNRIYLRNLSLNDVGDKYLTWINDEEVNRLTAIREKIISLVDLKQYVLDQINNPDVLFKAIILLDNDNHIGNIKLGPINWQKKTAEIGLIIGEKNQWGKGYGTEAIKLLCNLAFEKLKLNTLTAGYFLGNEASMKVFTKNNFHVTHTTKEIYQNIKYPVDVIWLSLQNPSLSE